jgi:hypothetical protein
MSIPYATFRLSTTLKQDLVACVSRVLIRLLSITYLRIVRDIVYIDRSRTAVAVL